MSDTWQYVISNQNWVQLTKDQDPDGPTPRWGSSATISTINPSSIIIFGN